jgi:hypothetical protein
LRFVTDRDVRAPELLLQADTLSVFGEVSWRMRTRVPVLFRIEDNFAQRVSRVDSEIFEAGSTVWFDYGSSVFRYEGGELKAQEGIAGRLRAVEPFDEGVLVVLHSGASYRVVGDRAEPLDKAGTKWSRVVYAAGRQWRLTAGPAFIPGNSVPYPDANVLVRSVFEMGDKAWFATDSGLFVENRSTPVYSKRTVVNDHRTVDGIHWLATNVGVLRIEGEDVENISPVTSCSDIWQVAGTLWVRTSNKECLAVRDDQLWSVPTDAPIADVVEIHGAAYALTNKTNTSTGSTLGFPQPGLPFKIADERFVRFDP